MSGLRSSIGKKIIMALSGLILLGFVIGHLAGNLLIYGGPDALNAYAKKLRDMLPLLWVARIGLIIAVIAHIITSIMLSRENRKARPQGYKVYKVRETTLGARTMLISGSMVVAFILYHLLHFTFRVTNPEISHATDALGRHDVYRMVVVSFQQPLISLAYVTAMAPLCFHLDHGIFSAWHTLGLSTEQNLPIAERISRTIALVIFFGYISMPVSVMLGFITPSGKF